MRAGESWNADLRWVGKSSTCSTSSVFQPITDTPPKMHDIMMLWVLVFSSQMKKTLRPEMIMLHTVYTITKLLYYYIH